MENSILFYVLKVNIVLIVLFAFYYIFLRRDTFFSVKRYYFLALMLLAFLLPFCNIKFFSNSSAGSTISELMQQVQLDAITVTAVTDNNAPTINISIIFAFMLSGSIALLLRTLVQCGSVLQLKRRNRQAPDSNIINITSTDINPFSFFKWIFINKSDLSEKELKEVIIHETVHVNQLHTIDILLSELIFTFFWWNPIVWIMKKHIRANLEYIADAKVLEHGIDNKQYQYHLLKLSSIKTTAVVNNFNVSQLKNRIVMMNKRKTAKGVLAKYLLALPVISFLFGLNSAWANNITSKVIDVVPDRVMIVNSEIKIESLPTESLHMQTTQKNQTPPPPPVKVGTRTKENGTVFTVVEQMPSYPGGDKALFEYLSNNIKYPEKAAKDSIQGKVIVAFIVSATGEIKDIKIQRSLNAECDAEAKRVVEAMPKWTPGKQNGVDVSVQYMLPINFKLSKSGK